MTTNNITIPRSTFDAMRDALEAVSGWQAHQGHHRTAITEARAALEQTQGEASEFDSPLSDFKEGQWWTLELDAIANSSSATNEQRRAIAVVRHLLRVIAATHTEPAPSTAGETPVEGGKQ